MPGEKHPIIAHGELYVEPIVKKSRPIDKSIPHEYEDAKQRILSDISNITEKIEIQEEFFLDEKILCVRMEPKFEAKSYVPASITQVSDSISLVGGRKYRFVDNQGDPQSAKLYFMKTTNAGIAALAECVPIGAMEFDKLVAFAKEQAIDFTIVGMDDPLVGGIVDVFEAEGLKVFGPRKNAAILEGSKAFSKDLMKKYHIPTAAYENFTSAEEALAYLETAKMPIVLKADGLALGKGVLICNTLEEAKAGVKEIMLDKKFGDAGNHMVIEEFMTGREVSVLSFVDGKTIKIMSSAQDHKRAQDGDKGLNTGGMGTFSPSPFYTKEVDEFCKKYVYQATVDAMARRSEEHTSELQSL